MILLVAIVVVLSVVSGAIALNLTEEREPAPEVRLTTEQSEDGYTYELVHEQGETINGDQLTLQGAAEPNFLSDSDLTVGERVEFYPVESNLTLIWTGDHGTTYSLTEFSVEQTIPAPDVGCSWVDNNSESGDIDIDRTVVDCNVNVNKVIEIYSGGTVIGDVVSDTKEADIDGGSVIYGDVEVQEQVNIQDSRVTGSVTAYEKNIKVDNTTVGRDVTAGDKEIEIIDDSSVNGDLVGDDDLIMVQSSSVDGSVVTEGNVDLDDATITGDIYVGGNFDCDDSTINGQDCSSYSPRDADDW